MTRKSRGLRAFAAATLLGLAGSSLCGCSSGGSEDTCRDVSANVCLKVAECGALTVPFGTPEKCVESFVGLYAAWNSTDAQCRDEWELVQELPCSVFLAHYEI
jgi:hypothetical protein